MIFLFFVVSEDWQELVEPRTSLMLSGGSLILISRSQFMYSGDLSRDSICLFVYVWEVFDSVKQEGTT